jgi:hypothetical protein
VNLAWFSPALLLFGAACSAPGSAHAPDLPFHVALIPLEARAAAAVADESESGSLTIALDSDELRGAIVSSLRKSCFVRVSTLEPPQGGSGQAVPSGLPEDMAAWDEKARLDWWIDRAVAGNVDLLALGSVTFSPVASGAINDRFWLNLPLFLLGGPMCWFVSDRSYEMQARLDLRLYDVRLIEQQRAQLGDRAAEVSAYQVEYSGTALSFVERAGGNLGAYALSVLVPAGLLVRSTENVERELREDAVASLCAGLEAKIQADRDRLLLPPGVNFVVRPEDIAVRRTEDGFAAVRGRVHFQPDSRVESLRGYALAAGGTPTTFGFGAPVADDAASAQRSTIYAIAGNIACPKDVDCVRLTIAHGGGDDRMRTYTLPIEREGRSVQGGAK